MPKTFYLWDLANTLFPETWNKDKSGFVNYDEYVKSLGYNLATIKPLEYEQAYEIPYKDGYFDLTISPGFEETLSWTKNNGVFTTGNKEQVDWRAVNFLPRYGFDIRDYLKEIYSTFDFGNTNLKTKEMLIELCKKIHNGGFKVLVYTDDKQANCDFFLKAVESATGQGVKLDARVYNFEPSSQIAKEINPNYFVIANLAQLLNNERELRELKNLSL